ncbi:MAG: radical SAM protein [Oscillospiraceae bacterium]|nr:radical SAM protein [Oscillospiraceae bacterium]
MKHSNIAIFIPHAGCRHKCSFCDQQTITAQKRLPGQGDVRCICEEAFREISDLSQTEIAFFGGSFTAIPHPYMLELLEAARPYAERCKGIRISTRPDAIDGSILHMLQTYSVRAIELGVQSLDDSVLQKNGRGHTAADVERACDMIRREGFELGLQIMPGLYGSTPETDRATAERVCEIHPDTVRIYPVVVLEGTELARLYKAGTYQPRPFEDMVNEVATMMRRFQEKDIRIIKVGLHASEFVGTQALGGYYHPAFRELCESRIFRKRIKDAVLLAAAGKWEEVYKIAVHPGCISKAIGQKQENLHYFYETFGTRLYIVPDRTVAPFEARIVKE